MNCTLNKFFIFSAGAVIGSAVTWKFLESKYQKLAQEEIESVKEVFSRRAAQQQPEPTKEEVTVEDKYEATLTEQGYNKYASTPEPVRTPSHHVISPEEFGEIDEYNTVSLIHYADGMLAYDDGELVADIDDIVGEDYASHFGEFEDDSVFVRNDERKTDYEILRDTLVYSDARKAMHPHRAVE